jgi:hypothetical protein
VSLSSKIGRFRAGIDISGKAPADLQRESDHERLVRVFPVAGELSSCPICMDRLLFATEGVLSEVAHMYPAC